MNRTTSVHGEAANDSQAQERVPTVDGTRVEIDQLNTGSDDPTIEVQGGPVKRFRHRLSQFLAGMYTGIGCSGVPHSHHTYSNDKDRGPI